MVLLIKVGGIHSVFDVRPNVVLQSFRPGDLISPEAVEKLILLSQSEAIGVNPSPINALEDLVQILLVILGALEQGHVWESSELLCAGRLRIAGQDSETISPRLC